MFHHLKSSSGYMAMGSTSTAGGTVWAAIAEVQAHGLTPQAAGLILTGLASVLTALVSAVKLRQEMRHSEELHQLRLRAEQVKLGVEVLPSRN